MELNAVNIIYLFFRLAPFIIVSYFSLSSIFNQDLKGLIYLVGVLLACFASIILGNSLPNIQSMAGLGLSSPACKVLTLNRDGSFSKIPLGLSIICYTFIYFVFIIVKFQLTMYNLPTLIFFPVLIVADFVWNMWNSCFGIFELVVAIIVGSLSGLLWANVIDRIGKPELFFLNVGSDKTVCHRPTKQLFKCTFKKPDSD